MLVTKFQTDLALHTSPTGDETPPDSTVGGDRAAVGTALKQKKKKKNAGGVDDVGRGKTKRSAAVCCECNTNSGCEQLLRRARKCRGLPV